MLNELLSYAKNKEFEKTVLPLWLAEYIIKGLQKEETISFIDYLQALKNKSASVENKNIKTDQQIKDEYISIVEKYKQKGVNDG